VTTVLNNAEGGTSGTTVTTGNSGGASGNAWDVVNIVSGDTIAFDNAHAAHGSLSYKWVVAASDLTNVEWTTTFGSQTTFYGRLYHYRTANFSGNITQFWSGNGGSLYFSMALDSGGHIFYKNSAGTTILTFTTPLPTSAWSRIEWTVTAGAGTGSGTISFYPLDSIAATETHSFTGQQFGASTFTVYAFGDYVGAGAGTFWLDDMGLSTTGYLGPVVNTPSVGRISYAMARVRDRWRRRSDGLFVPEGLVVPKLVLA
jgi:hypothetical protein